MSTEQNNQEVVMKEGFGTKFKNGLKKAWNFTEPVRDYVANVVGMAGMYAAAGGAMVAGALFVADKLTKDTDPDSESDAADVSVEDTTPEE